MKIVDEIVYSIRNHPKEWIYDTNRLKNKDLDISIWQPSDLLHIRIRSITFDFEDFSQGQIKEIGKAHTDWLNRLSLDDIK